MISPLSRLQGTLAAALVSLLIGPAFGQAPTSRKARHDELVSMAHELVRHHPELLCDAAKPQFRICNEGHLHWCTGWVGLTAGTFPMEERLRIEWFWTHLTPAQRIFWRPYLRRVDELTLQYMEVADQRELTLDEEQAFGEAADEIYESGVNEFARRRGVTPQNECDAVCCAAAFARIVLTSNVKNVESIQWIDAGTVWLSVAATGKDPQFNAYAPGATVPVYPESIYYYKLRLSDGRISQKTLAPKIIGNESPLVLTWQ